MVELGGEVVNSEVILLTVPEEVTHAFNKVNVYSIEETWGILTNTESPGNRKVHDETSSQASDDRRDGHCD